ncbi:MAG: adenosylcobinamide-GDP ribazoletransferase [Spongiibacteraceae bacterium]|jgi:adenosylcobinamide-GDP ribazoletransferase
MNTWLKALATAFIFLTRLPMPTFNNIEPEDEGRSLLCFPIVGIFIGLLLWIIGSSLHTTLSPLVLAAVLTAFWAAVTGGLHLDGLADSADGWLGGLGDVDKTLTIMHDSRCGSGALVAVVCLLILKFAALTVIVQHQLWPALLVAPILGRCAGPLLFIPGRFLYTPYVQPSGIAKNFIDHCPSVARHTVAVLTIACALFIGNFWIAIAVITASTLTLYLMRRMMLKRLGGATGDTAGACTEVIETVVLIVYGAMLPAVIA